MPTRTLYRILRFDVQALYTQFLSSQSGWSGGSAEDINDITWDTVARTLTVVRIAEPNLVRRITYTAQELYTALASSQAGWTGGSGATIYSCAFDAAGRTLTLYKVSEAA